MGLPMSVFDIAPTILHIYGVPAPEQMKGRILSEIFEASSPTTEAAANR
jgi:arylsulfatase A-like enzyme